MAIRRQLAHAKALVGFALDAELGKKTFWTFSVWETQEDLDAFSRSDPHRRIIERLRPHMGQSRFEFFSVSGEPHASSFQNSVPGQELADLKQLDVYTNQGV